MVKPSPLLAANISLITIRMIADRQRLPQRRSTICGLADAQHQVAQPGGAA